MSRGPNVFAVSRAIWDHDAFAPEPFSQREAWIWLIGAAAWKDMRVRGHAGSLALKRGEFCFSVRFLAEKWQWSKSRVDRVISALEKQDMIRDTSRDGSKVYLINNYNRFQVVGLPKRDSDRDDERDEVGTEAGQKRDKEETGKQENSKTEEQEPTAKAVVPVSRETKSLVVVQSLPAWLQLEAWSGYLDMRRRTRKPLTPHAIGLLIGRLDRFRAKGHDPTEMLEGATIGCWSSVFEPKDQGYGNSRQKPPSANDKNLAGAAIVIASLIGDDEQRGQGEAGGDAGGSFFPLLDTGLHARTGGGKV